MSCQEFLLQSIGMSHHRLFTTSLFIGYMVLMTTVMVWQGIEITPDRYLFVLLIPTFFINRIRNFLFDWTPFLFILIAYDFLRGFADLLTARVHYQEMIDFDFLMFGTIPSIKLQQWFFNPMQSSWYDYLFTVLYFLHFALPLAFGYILWLNNRSYFKQFVTGLLLLTYTSLLTYVIYPAAPPPVAQEQGYLQGVHKVLNQTLSTFPDRWDIPNLYHSFNPNHVAAVPSLHAAFPFLIFLFSVKFFNTKGLAFVFYPITMWFAVVYLGEHYVFDVILGVIYALLAFVITNQVLHNPKLKPYLLYPFQLLRLR